MELNKRGYKKPAMEIVTFEKIALPIEDVDTTPITVVDTSRHSQAVFMINNISGEGLQYSFQVANVKEDGTMSEWVDLEARQSLMANEKVVMVKQCVADRMKLSMQNETPGSVASIDLFVRLVPFGTIV